MPRYRGINLSIQLDRIDRSFGGCAMNIAYTLRLLGHDPVPFVIVGHDFDQDYAAHLATIDMDTSGISVADVPYSSYAFIFTDREKNQFTGFFGGPTAADGFATRLRDFASDFDYAILAPDTPANMIAAATVARERGIPFLTDPGQNLTDFTARDAIDLVRLSDTLIVNEFEHATLKRFAGGALDELELLVVTKGRHGASWHCRDGDTGYEPAVAANVVSPTGCGDAFRAGFVHARLHMASIRDAVRAGEVAAATVLEAPGTQTHRGDGFEARYRRAWRAAPPWMTLEG